MKFKKGLALLATASICISLLSACSGGDKEAKGEGKEEGNKGKVIKIVSQTPLSGGSATLGESIKLGAQLKLEEQKEHFKELGFTLKFDSYDDQGDPKKGVSNAQLLVADTSVLAVVGHLNSGVSIPSSEVYEKEKIVMVSPASTATDLTDRKLKSVNRTVARDDFQGPAGADFAINKLKVKKIFVIQDKTAYGQGLADAFKKGAEDLGAEIVGYEGITVGEKDFNGVLNKVLAKKPDLIYFGGIYTEGGLLIKQARDKGIKAPFMGGDGLDSSTLVEIAGDNVADTYITSVAADATKSATGQVFAQNYKTKFGKNVESYSAYAYDAMGVVLKGVEDAIKANGNKLPSREQVRDAVRSVQGYVGAISKVSFDEKGDNKQAGIYIFKFDKKQYPGSYVGEILK